MKMYQKYMIHRLGRKTISDWPFTSRSSGIEINKKLTSIKDSIEETKWFESRDPSLNEQPFLVDLLKAIAS